MRNLDLKALVEKILSYARPLEKARIQHLLFDGSSELVIQELLQFQNEDGGFGHALEPDLWNPNSSPIQTWVATEIIKGLKMNPVEPIILNTLHYLEQSFNTKSNKWPLLYPENDRYPHAPWWSYRIVEDDFNPSASLSSFVLLYGNPHSKVYQYALTVAKDAIKYILHSSKPIEMHELNVIIDMANDILQSREKQLITEVVKDALIKHIDQVIEKDASKWFTSYCAKPSSLIHKHPSIGSNQYLDLIYKEFDMALDHRNEEGVWPVTWQWSDYPQAFEKAKQMWTGIIGYGYLALMIHFKYIKK